MNTAELLEHRDRTDRDIRTLSNYLEKNFFQMLQFSNEMLGMIEEAHVTSCNTIVDLMAQVDSLTEELRDAQDYIDSNL